MQPQETYLDNKLQLRLVLADCLINQNLPKHSEQPTDSWPHKHKQHSLNKLKLSTLMHWPLEERVVLAKQAVLVWNHFHLLVEVSQVVSLVNLQIINLK